MPIHGKQHPDCQRKPINKKILRTKLQYDINVQQEREKKRQAVVFVSSFHPRGGVFCYSWRDGAGGFFPEAGRGGCLFFPRRDGAGFFFCPRRDGVVFFFFSTGRDGAVFFFFFEGRDGTVVFGGGLFFGGTGQNRYTVPPKAV